MLDALMKGEEKLQEKQTATTIDQSVKRQGSLTTLGKAFLLAHNVVAVDFNLARAYIYNLSYINFVFGVVFASPHSRWVACLTFRRDKESVRVLLAASIVSRRH